MRGERRHHQATLGAFHSVQHSRLEHIRHRGTEILPVCVTVDIHWFFGPFAGNAMFKHLAWP